MAQISISDDDLRVLGLIREGHNVMSELFDMTNWPGERINKSVEKLDENRYIEREGLHGLGFWSFKLTAKGEECLPKLSAADEKLCKLGLVNRDIDFLNIVKKNGKGRATDIIINATRDFSMQREYAGSVVKLVRMDYLIETGFLKRYIEISPKGEKAVAG